VLTFNIFYDKLYKDLFYGGETMEKPLNWRERVVDTIDAYQLNENRIKPLTEYVDFYTQAKTYKRGLRDLEKEKCVIVGTLEPMIR